MYKEICLLNFQSIQNTPQDMQQRLPFGAAFITLISVIYQFNLQ